MLSLVIDFGLRSELMVTLTLSHRVYTLKQNKTTTKKLICISQGTCGSCFKTSVPILHTSMHRGYCFFPFILSIIFVWKFFLYSFMLINFL